MCLKQVPTFHKLKLALKIKLWEHFQTSSPKNLIFTTQNYQWNVKEIKDYWDKILKQPLLSF